MVQARRVDEQPVRSGLPERADAAHDVAGAALCDGRVSHGGALRAGCLGDQLHGQVSQRGHAADDELAGGLQAHHERLECLGGVDAQLLDGFFPERPGGRVVLVLVKGKSNAGRRERLDGAGGATAVVFAVFTSHDPSVGRVRGWTPSGRRRRPSRRGSR